jgi:nitrogen regulatory protein PII
VKPEELKNVAVMLRELGLSYDETLVAVRGVAKDSHFVGRLWREDDKGRLVKIGLALIAFPDPIVTDVIGAILVSAGVIQAKIKRSTLHVEDVYETFPKLIKELQTSKRELI